MEESIKLVQFQLNCYHHGNLLFLSAILKLATSLMKNSLGQLLKDDDESDQQLIQFELFLTYEMLILLVSAIANAGQVLFAILVSTLFGDWSFQYTYLMGSVINGALIWWTLLNLKRTSYRKSKLLLLLSHSLFLVPSIAIAFDFAFGSMIIAAVSFSIQMIGILFGMAAASLKYMDAFGEFKQQFHETQSTGFRLLFYIKYGLLPYLVLLPSLKDRNYIDFIYFAFTQYSQCIIMTYFDTHNLKTNWVLHTKKLALSPILFVVPHLIFTWNIDLEYILTLSVLSFGSAAFAAITLQRYIQETRKIH